MTVTDMGDSYVWSLANAQLPKHGLSRRGLAS